MKELLAFSKEFNQELPAFFAKPKGVEKKVLEAMDYSLLNGGKRLRPFLVYEVAKLFGINFKNSLRLGVALEMLHTYSLIHDDLPAMDNDDLRRGKPTCHKAFDEATAILAGDGLLTLAFEVLSNPQTCPNPEKRCQLIAMLANAGGAYDGMIAGQSLDLQATTPSQIEEIEVMKTGRLILYAVQAGAVFGDATPAQFEALSQYARKIGQAFQIADDILDIEGSTEKMGKTLKKDIAQNKITFVALYGIEKAKVIAQNLINDAIENLKMFGDKAEQLKLLANFIITREN